MSDGHRRSTSCDWSTFHAGEVRRSLPTSISSREGFYPEGGGEVVTETSPTGGLKPVNLGNRGRILTISGSRSLRISRNTWFQAETFGTEEAHRVRRGQNRESDIRTGRSTGAGVVLVAEFENTLSPVGAWLEGCEVRTLGGGCAEDLLETVRSGATVDEHMLDQILPYMALAGKVPSASRRNVRPRGD